MSCEVRFDVDIRIETIRKAVDQFGNPMATSYFITEEPVLAQTKTFEKPQTNQPQEEKL